MPRNVKGGLSVEVDGLVETLRAVRGVQDELRPSLNGELRDTAGACADELVPFLTTAAEVSGVPVARRVASSIVVRRDRIPTVSIGGARRVGRAGAPAGSLVWGSEQGPKSDPNHWGVGPSSGWWIKPAVDRFARGSAIQRFQSAIARIVRRYGLAGSW
jgi:hypothetical protein